MVVVGGIRQMVFLSPENVNNGHCGILGSGLEISVLIAAGHARGRVVTFFNVSILADPWGPFTPSHSPRLALSHAQRDVIAA